MFRRFLTSLRFAAKNLRANAARTVLTLVGIVIGIMSVIVVSSSGQGVKEYVLGQFSSYGDDLIQIETKVPSTGKNSGDNAMGQAQGIEITTLKTSDAEALSKLPNVQEYAAGDLGQEIVSYRGENKRTILYGVGANMPDIDQGIKVDQGEFFSPEDDASLGQVVVIGSDIKETLFGSDEALGKNVRIKGMNFRVVGVAAKRGAVTFFNYDELIYLPVRTLEKKILGIDHVQFVSLKVKDVQAIDVTAADVTDTMRRLHNIRSADQDDFAVTTMQEARDMIDKVFGTIDILLLALTSISLIVGGVGIMNVMYVAVVERTFEIGLRKSVGAREADIRNQFLLEAVVITLIGGAVGIVLGYLASWVFSFVMAYFGFSLRLPITLRSVLISVGFSMLVGVVFGFYPAYRASKLSPMEALRKE